MPAGTLPSARVAPPRRFENYILTRVVDSSAGLTNIEDSRFTHVPGVGPDAAGNQDSVSSTVPIGFPFQIDGITYDHFAVSMHGWLVLVDPTTGFVNTSDIVPFGTWLNTRIQQTFSSKQVLLAPWMDDSRALAAVPSSLASINGSYNSTLQARYNAGLEPRPPQLNSVGYGVSYYNDNRSSQGRRLIVRWSIISNFYNGTATSVLKFECVIYENGTIEYRYAPKGSLASPPQYTNGVYQGYEGATIGVFMPNGTNRFRDFAVGLGYREGSRAEYIYGGFVYDPNYTDTDQSGILGGEDYGHITNYTVNLIPFLHWPGLNAEGSIFTFSPPLNRRKVLPRRAIREQDGKLSLPLVARTGDDRTGTALASYDDRRAPIYAQNFTQVSELINPGAALSGLQWLLPRVGDLNSSVYVTVGTQTVVTTLAGDPTKIYQVPLRFRGVVEYKGYSGGSQPDAGVPQFRLGGTPSGSDWNIYSLTISDPPATYYLNNGADSSFTVHLIDYTEIFNIRGGATVTMVANPVDSGPYEIANNANTGGPLSVPGITSPAQPYVGQFIRMDFVGSLTSSFSNFTVSGSVNYPTTLPRFFGGTAPGTLQRQNLFSGDMVVSGVISKAAVEPYLDERAVTSMPAFNESRRPDLIDPPNFFATGSTIASVGDGFTQPLKSKTQVRVQLPIVDPVPLPASTPSIFYYNQRLQCWEVPVNSSYAVPLGGTTTPAGSTGGDWSNPQTYLNNSQYPEDFRGFNPMGALVASGSHVTDSQAQAQTDANFYQPYLPKDLIKYVARNYPKSIRTNDNYAPSLDETFTIPITQPFLVEKATFEIPLALGPGWFADQTQCFAPFGGGSFAGGAPPFDVGGPALTVALMRHVPLQEQGLAGQSHGSQSTTKTSLRDLIMTGTITHTYDYVTGVALRNFPGQSTNFQMQPVGFLNYANPAGAVVADPGNQVFTGSITVEAQACSCAGVDLAYAVTLGGTGAQKEASAVVALTTPTLTLGSGSFGANNTAYTTTTNFISAFGRAGDGFQQAGRAILGNEYATLQNSFDPTGQKVVNPLFLTNNSSALPAQIQQALAQIGGGSAAVTVQAVVSLKSHFPSPYLLMPGDKLVLSISKARPFTYTQNSTQISSSLGGHDVKLMPGAVNITLYGSQVAAGAEYHDPLNQPLASDAVHELIGAEAVLDQFEPAYRNEYTGSFTDNVMVGSLLSTQVSNGQLMFTTGSRYRAVSMLEPTLSASIFIDKRLGDATRDKYVVNGLTASYPFPSASQLPPVTVYNSVPPTLDLSLANAEINDSKAYRLQSWMEQVGTNRVSQFTDDSERYWDSLMPSVAQAFAADGCGIFVTRYGAFGNAQQVNAVSTALVGQSSLNTSPTQQPLGWIWFDYQLPTLIDNPAGSSYAPLINANWTKAYPFEPRYQGASRQLSVQRGLIATYLFQPAVQQPGIANAYIAAGTPLVQPITPTPVTGFMFGPVAAGTSVNATTVGFYTQYQWFFFGYFFGFPIWLYLPVQYPIQGLVYTVGDTCNTWLGDCAVGPPAPSGSSGMSSNVTFGLNPFGYYTTSSAGLADISRCLFGFGDSNTYFQRIDFYGNTSLLGTGHYAEFRDQEGPHPNGLGISGTDNNIFKFGPRIRGWKYGVASGLPLFSKAYWRRGRFGQFRDMLEQRPYTKYYESPENGPTNPSFQQGVKEACVTVKYLSPDGRLTEPSNTWSSNLSFECTSSIPYIEGVPTNRPVVNVLALNKHILSFRQDFFGNLRL